MIRTSVPTRHERLIGDLTDVAVALQALAQKLRNAHGLPNALRAHAPKLAQAGRDAALTAVTANGGKSTHELSLFYGQWLSTTGKRRDSLDAFDEEGLNSQAGVENEGSNPD